MKQRSIEGCTCVPVPDKDATTCVLTKYRLCEPTSVTVPCTSHSMVVGFCSATRLVAGGHVGCT